MMEHSNIAVLAFAQQHIDTVSTVLKLPMDASTRVYYRVYGSSDNGKQPSYIIMDASHEHNTIEPFQRISEYLRARDLHAPEVLAVDREAGLMLLEDLGDDHLIQYVHRHPTAELEAYKLAVDGLVRLHNAQPAKWLPPQDTALLLRGAEVFIDWWVGRSLSGQQLQEAAVSLRELLGEYYRNMPQLPQVVVLRDYHAENLLLVPGAKGLWRLGIIDFQDAVIGSPAYDLMSILEDGRRIVPDYVVQSCLDYYIERTGIDGDALYQAYMTLGLQRNLRILGRFSQLIHKENRQKYAQFMERKFHFVQQRLERSEFHALRRWFDEYGLYTS